MAGELPTAEQLADFRALIDEQRDLPDGFTANYIMKPPTRDIMNCLSRSVLQLYAFDERAKEHERPNARWMSTIMLLSRLPRIMVLAYHVISNKIPRQLDVHPSFRGGTEQAETILSMLRPDRSFTDTEAKTLDIMLVFMPSTAAATIRRSPAAR